MRPTDPDMFARTAEEIRRLGKTPSEIGRLIGCNRKVVHYWLDEGGVPCAVYLSRLHDIGFDVMYVITGKRFLNEVPL